MNSIIVNEARELAQRQLRQQVGEDMQPVLTLREDPNCPNGLLTLPEVELLRQIFAQHYEVKQGDVRWRDGPAVRNANRVLSPYDPQARSSRKREMTWQGDKVHLTETCD